VVPADSTPDRLAPPASSPNILTALTDNEKVAKTGADADKAVAVCWLMHLVGDIHQPLHAVSYYDDDHPKGDRGGKLLRARDGGRRRHQPSPTLGRDAGQ
jgi:hypothetical protein